MRFFISKILFFYLLFYSASSSAMCGYFYSANGAIGSSPGAACNSFYDAYSDHSLVTSFGVKEGLCVIGFDIYPIDTDGSPIGDGEEDSFVSASITKVSCVGGYDTAPRTQKECGKPCPAECPTSSGNPIDTFSGYKYQTENDLQSDQFKNFDLSRQYFWDTDTGLWRFAHERSLYISGSLKSVERPSGQIIDLIDVRDDNGEIVHWVDVRGWLKVILLPNGHYQMAFDNVYEEYDAGGLIFSITDQTGRVIQYLRDPVANTVTIQNDQVGFSIAIFYDTARVIDRIEDSTGRVYRYSYNSNKLLEYVSFPDDTPNALGANPFGEDNPFKQYHYEDLNYPTALTGITDELGNRSFTWAYDSEGRTILSKHDSVGVVDQVTLDFSFVDDPVQPRVIETNSLGYRSTFHYAEIDGERKVTLVERDAHTNSADASISCAAANQHTTYDANGYKNLVTDWQGNVTDFDYDDRGLEISRVEAQRWQGDVIDSVVVVTAETKTVTTEWHPDLRLPTKITEPDRVIVMTYDPENGRELSRVEYAVGSEP